jgi:Stress responsive A/B Barrel Domain
LIRTTAFAHLRPDAAPARVDELIDAARRAAEETGACASDASRVTTNAFRAGDVMLLGAYPDRPALEHAKRSAHVTEVLRPLLAEVATHVEAVRYTQGAVMIREPDLTDGIHRSLLVRVDPATDPVLVEQFERELAAMPTFIDAISNSSLSRIDTMHASLGPEYTHVWEQEFASLDGLTGPYMQHAYHWSVIDPWFDVQAPVHIVDPVLIHSSCDLRRSILTLA